LRREMAAIRRSFLLEVPREAHRERPPEGNANPDPKLERCHRTFTALELRVPRARAPNSAGHLLLCQPQPPPDRPGLAAERRRNRRGFATPADRGRCRSLEPPHDAWIIVFAASLRIARRVAARPTISVLR